MNGSSQIKQRPLAFFSSISVGVNRLGCFSSKGFWFHWLLGVVFGFLCGVKGGLRKGGLGGLGFDGYDEWGG